MNRTFKYRIYPKGTQKQALEQTLNTCRHLYNDSLAERKQAYTETGKSVTYLQQQNELTQTKKTNQYYQQVHAQVLQDTLHRLDKSFKAFFRRVKIGEKAGYPRFKSKDRYDSFCYPQSGFGIRDKKLCLSKIGSIRIFQHRLIEGTIKTCTIRRDNRQWYACFVVELPDRMPELKTPEHPIGIDLGLKNLITISNGEQVSPPKFLRLSEQKLINAQKLLSRKTKGSNNRIKQRNKVASIHQHIREQRKDFAHQLSRNLVNRFDHIVFEDLSIQNMLQNHHLAKSISDASWSQLVAFTKYKAEEAGIIVETVNPYNTSQACSSCGGIVQKGLAERIHSCSCGLVLDRDLNAALNVLNKSTLGLRGRACGELR